MLHITSRWPANIEVAGMCTGHPLNSETVNVAHLYLQRLHAVINLHDKKTTSQAERMADLMNGLLNPGATHGSISMPPNYVLIKAIKHLDPKKEFPLNYWR